MAVIEVYMGTTGTPIRVKCRTRVNRVLLDPFIRCDIHGGGGGGDGAGQARRCAQVCPQSSHVHGRSGYATDVRKYTRCSDGVCCIAGTPLLRKKDKESPVASLRLSKAVVDELIFIAELYDGTRRALMVDESPVELLSNRQNGVRRLLFVTPSMLSQLPDAVVTPIEDRPVCDVAMEDSDEEPTPPSKGSFL
jgi:hypothetical protein